VINDRPYGEIAAELACSESVVRHLSASMTWYGADGQVVRRVPARR
jgi:hypothetical protein